MLTLLMKVRKVKGSVSIASAVPVLCGGDYQCVTEQSGSRVLGLDRVALWGKLSLMCCVFYRIITSFAF